MGSFEQLWNKLEIRVLVISSLSLQIFLLAIAGFRKYIVSVRWAQTTGFKFRGPLAFIFHLFLWLAYLLADYVATVALAYIPGSEISKTNRKSKNDHHLLMFWTPFFILHLGGQDTITALSVEDNELWARHLLTLCSQVALAIYYYRSSNLHIGELWPPAALMFAVAIFKYGERVVSLHRASMSALRSSMITKPDPGPNYAKFMQEYTSSKEAGLQAEIKVEVEKHKGDLEKQQPKDLQQKEIPRKYEEVVCQAYKFFQTFKRLFVDLILSYKNRDESQKYFETLEKNDAYKLIEIELMWMYEILHSKGSIIYSYKHYGWISRVTTLVITSVALYLFASSNHNEYKRFDTSLTYVLLVGAVSLEIIAIIFILLSFWTYASMKDCWFYKPFSKYLFFIMEKMRPKEKPRWSNRMAQYSLITYSLRDTPRWWKSIVKFLGLKDTWDHYRYTSCVKVNEDLKELVFRELKKKMNNIDDTASYRRFTEHRGQWALQRKGYYQEFGWSVEAEFDESILLWHIATHLLFHDFKMFKEELKNQELNSVSQTVLPGVSEPVSLPVSRSVTAPVSQMVLPGVSEPVSLPVSRSVTAPVSQMALPGVSEPVLLPVPQSVMAPVLQTVLPGVSEPVLLPVSRSVTAPVSQMVLPGVSEPVSLPVSRSVTAPVSQMVLPGVSEPVLFPVSQSVMALVLQTVLPGVSEPVLRPVAQSVTAPVSQMVLPGVSEPVLLPVAQSVMAPVSEPVLLPVSQSEHKNEPKFNSEPEISHEISNYMMFLLIVRPFMMPAGIGQIRFGDTCAEAKNFLQQQGHIDMVDAVQNILDVNTDYDPALVKGIINS